MTTQKPKIITLEAAVELMKQWPIKYLIVGMRKKDDEYYPDSVVVNSDEQFEDAKKRFVYSRLFKLSEL